MTHIHTPINKTHIGIAVLIGLLTVILLTLTAPAMGLTWDEPAYIAAAEAYVEWYGILFREPSRALDMDTLSSYWQANHEHPPLDKIWSGLVWSVGRHVLDDLTAHRLGNVLLVGLVTCLLYLLVTRHYGPLAGGAAVVALMTMPRFFFHAHLAALDIPAAAAVFGTIFAFWMLQDRRSWAWDLLIGLIFGLALATKVNAVFIPPTIFIWVVLFEREFHLFRRLFVSGLIAVPLSLVIWPWLYFDTGSRLDWYIRFITIDHWKIGQYYLGKFHIPPPWHFAFVMTLAVVPLTLTALYLVGIVRTFTDRQRRERLAIGGLLIICALVPLIALALGKSMVYDNDRLFMPAFPYLAALAGVGFDWAYRGLNRWLNKKNNARLSTVLFVTLSIVVLAPHLLSASTLYPHLLSYYSETVGGLRGATRLQLETTYWCETYARVIPYLNEHARPGDAVWVQPWSHDVLFYYQMQGKLRSDIFITWPEDAVSAFWRKRLPNGREIKGLPIERSQADWVVLQYRQTGFDPDLRRWIKWREPLIRIEAHGIPLLDLYAEDTEYPADTSE